MNRRVIQVKLPTVHITYAALEDCERVQPVFLHKEVIGWLGGMTMMDTLKAAAVTPKSGKVGLWYATVEDRVVGALLCGGRPMAFRAKYGSVGVVPEFRRMRISTALYCCMTLQQILEGRRLWEDSIVGDNPHQHLALPTYGLKRVGELRHRTGSGKGLVLYDFSLMEEGALDKMIYRATSGPFPVSMQLLSNYYSDETWEANMGAYLKQQPKFAEYINDLRARVLYLPFVRLVRDDTNPTDLRRKPSIRSILDT